MSFSPVVKPEVLPIIAKMAAAAAVGCYAIFEVSHVVMRKFTTSKNKNPSGIVFLASCFGSMANALTTSLYALSAFHEMVVSSDKPISLTMSAPDQLVWSCGITVGYFIADCLQMVIYHKEYKEQMKATGMALMWGHHLISIVMWPYSVLTHKTSLFVGYFLVTEVTNIGQNFFHFANKTGASPKVTLGVGVLWIFSFFVFRILPLPWLLYHYVNLIVIQGGVGLTAGETVASLLTVPLPFMLNLYWFDLLVKKALRMARGGSKPAKSQ